MNISFPLTGLHAPTRAAHRVLCWGNAVLHAGEYSSRKSLFVEKKNIQKVGSFTRRWLCDFIKVLRNFYRLITVFMLQVWTHRSIFLVKLHINSYLLLKRIAFHFN